MIGDLYYDDFGRPIVITEECFSYINVRRLCGFNFSERINNIPWTWRKASITRGTWWKPRIPYQKHHRAKMECSEIHLQGRDWVKYVKYYEDKRSVCSTTAEHFLSEYQEIL